MKRACIISLLVCLSGYGWSQKQINQYEYWFDNAYSANKSNSITATTIFNLETSIPTLDLPTGLHTFQVRFKDNNGAWSSTITQFFVKPPITSGVQSTITNYEYWFDNNASSKISNTVTTNNSISLVLSIRTGNLPTGLHTFQVRFKDNNGAWSSTTTQFFVKPPKTIEGQGVVSQYEYWFDSNYTGKVQQTVPLQSGLSLVSSISASSLPAGLHTFQIRFKGSAGTWSSTTTQFFVKPPKPIEGKGAMNQYEYWFDSNYTGKVQQTVPLQSELSLVSSIPASSLPSGLHTFQIRFKGNAGEWSSTTTQFFVKPPVTTGVQSVIMNYEYWFDNNSTNKINQAVTTNNSISLVSTISTGNLPTGLHTFQARFKDNLGNWSSTTTQFFIKPTMSIVGENKIIAYEYWFNDSISRRTHVDVNPINPLELKNILLPVNSLITHITKDNSQLIKDKNGNYQFATTNRIYIRFKDTRGAWSAVNDTAFTAIIDDVDLTSFIINPDASEDNLGWTTNGPIGGFIQNTTHWSGKTNPYFCLGNSAITGWTSGMSQTISGLPAGTYTLKATGRAATETTMILTVGGVSVDFPADGAAGGEIWEDADTGSAEKNCNNGAGFGWSKRNLTFTTDGSPFVIQVSGIATKSGQWFDIDEFTLSVNNAASLDVSLPDNVNAANYKGCTLQLTNKKTDAKISQATTSNKTYTFNGLTPTNYYSVALLTPRGTVIAGIDSVVLVRGNNAVKFTALKDIVPVTLQVLTPAKKDVTDDATIQWYDADKKFMIQGDSLPDMPVGTVVYYSVALNKELGSQFKIPDVQIYTVAAGINNIVYNLQKVDSVVISGTLKDENKWPIAGGSVAIAQLLNGRYAKNFTTLTDKNGIYSATVFNDSSIITLSYPGYISQTRSFSNFNDSTNLGATILRPITGLTLTTNFTYTASVAAGETAVTESYYANYANIAYQVYDLAKGKTISKFNVQYPNLIIQDTTSVNDQIRITATSKTSDFSPVSSVFVVNQSNKDTVSFDLKELGAIKATYSNSPNSAPVGILYNAQGQLVKKDSYYNATLTFGNLPDGSYTLVSMTNSTYFNAVLNLSELTASGLTQGTDYTLNNVEVKSGVISTISVSSIPALNESKFYYTGSNTTFSVNKTSVTAGNYVTLSAKLDFKNQYAGKVSNVNLIVDIPDSCSFVMNSVMVGTSIAPYTLEDNRITISLNDNYSNKIRFCITPTIGGTYAPTAFVKFDTNTKTITQPIGSASFTATDMSITVPGQTAKKTISVSGTAPAYSTVSIYDGTTLIGQTTALAIGTWMTSCDLYEAYNLTTHGISAKIQTPIGITIQTATQNVEYNISLVEVKTVTMINTAHGPASLDLKEYDTVFDFQHPSASMPPYWYWPNYADFTFKIDFTNNDTAYVSNVILYVKTSSNDIVPLAASFDKKKDIWVATRQFTSNSLPVNVSVGYKANSEALIDQNNLNDIHLDNTGIINNNKIEVSRADSIQNIAQTELNKENPDYSYVSSLLNQINSNITNDSTTKSFLSELSIDNLLKYIDINNNRIDSLINDTLHNSSNFYKAINSYSDYKSYQVTLPDGRIANVEVKNCDNLNIENLKAQGYNVNYTVNKDSIFTKITVDSYEIIDFKRNVYENVVVSNSTTENVMSKMKSNINGDVEDKIKKSIDSLTEICSSISKWLNDQKKDLYLDLLKEQYQKNGEQIVELDNRIKLVGPDDINEFLKLKLVRKGLVLEQLNINVELQKQKLISKTFNDCFKLMDALKNVISLSWEEYNELKKIKSLEVPGCALNKYPFEAESLQLKINILYTDASNYYAICAIRNLAYIIGDAAVETITDGAGIILLIWEIDKIQTNYIMDEVFKSKIDDRIIELQKIITGLGNKCKNCPGDPDCPCTGPNCPPPPGGGPGTPSGSSDVPHQMDPSGYVYEAVSSNRLEGVTATIYYKTNEADMYGDTHEVITKWDAAPYLQVNPQTTDENGVYAWDVPDGLWQVKYEKAGYETIYSDWLPVPPPQLDINIGMKHTIPPTVKKVRGYEEGINIKFDKYMELSTMTTKQISVTHKSLDVSGTVRMLNEEEGYAADTAKYVSKVRFVPSQAFTAGDSVKVTVRSTAKSYLGMPMASDFVQVVKIEKEVKAITSDSLAEMKIHGNRIITVTVSPAAAAKGKSILANSASPSIVSLNSNQAVLDDNGKATFSVNGDLPGGTTVQFTMSDVDDLSAVTNVNVSLTTQVSAPTPSITSGVTVPKDTTVILSCPTNNATIYYTTDGTSPSDSVGTRQVYKNPITITKSTTIKAIAVKDGFDNSEVVQFTYSVVDVLNIVNVNAKFKSIKAFPNPAKNNQSFLLEINATEADLKQAELTILSVNGQLILQRGDLQQKMQLSGLSRGCYIIHVRLITGELLNEKLMVK